MICFTASGSCCRLLRVCVDNLSAGCALDNLCSSVQQVLCNTSAPDMQQDGFKCWK